ncbi:MAG: polyketide cyclase [Betaproteobacteria bacterium]|nr:polyketide cyclase [Betaproteobacteria bacterium]
MNRLIHQADPDLDLVFERVVDIPPHLIWAAWTTEEHIKHWFTPAPWRTIGCTIDLRPGGLFHTVMVSPEGQEFPNSGCYLEIVPNEKLVWTNALQPGYRPARPPANASVEFSFSAVISLEAQGAGTRYSALVIHADADACARHKAMGFHKGWGIALDQLVAYMKTL